MMWLRRPWLLVTILGCASNAAPTVDAQTDLSRDDVSTPSDTSDVPDQPDALDAAALDAFAPDAAADVATDGFGCDARLSLCGDLCVDTQTSTTHCGRCGASCAAPGGGVARCVDGRCAGECPAGSHLCGGDCASNAAVATCGASCSPCAPPTNATSRCVSGACDFVCDDTFVRVGAACVRLEPPRPIAPLTTATVTSRRPRLRWALAAGTGGARVELCADRACARVIHAYDADGSTVTVADELPTGVVFWRLHGRNGSMTGAATSPVWYFVVGARSATVNTASGVSLDVDGDGLSDVAVGAPNRMSSVGRVYVHAGGASGYAATPSATLDGRDGMNAVFGAAIAAAGDTNGDGYVDLAVGAYRAVSGAGRVYVYPGGATGVGATPSVVLSGRDGADGDFGVSVAGAGDVNGDGYADLVVGASVVSRFTGKAYVFHGGPMGLAAMPSTSLTGPDGPDGNFGQVVSGAGDLNGDGYGDVVITAPMAATATGAVYVYLGSASGLVTPAATVLRGTDGTLADFGQSAVGAGDVNGDGYSDVLVGADRVGRFTGRAYLFVGSASGLVATPARTFVGTATTDYNFGASLAAAGDINRDGYADLAVYGANVMTGGRVRVIPGGPSGPDEAMALTLMAPDGATSGFGASLQGAGDVNGDGFADLVVSAPGAASQMGRAYLFRGASEGVPLLLGAPLTGSDPAGSGWGNALAARGR